MTHRAKIIFGPIANVGNDFFLFF